MRWLVGLEAAGHIERDLMRSYVEAARQRAFVQEARRQSQSIAGSPDEAEIMRWMEDVSGGGVSE